MATEMKKMKLEMKQQEQKSFESRELKTKIFMNYEQIKSQNERIKENSEAIIAEMNEKIALL